MTNDVSVYVWPNRNDNLLCSSSSDTQKEHNKLYGERHYFNVKCNCNVKFRNDSTIIQKKSEKGKSAPDFTVESTAYN